MTMIVGRVMVNKPSLTVRTAAHDDLASSTFSVEPPLPLACLTSASSQTPHHHQQNLLCNTESHLKFPTANTFTYNVMTDKVLPILLF